MGFYNQLDKKEAVTGLQELDVNTSHYPIFIEVSGTGSVDVTYFTPNGQEIVIDDGAGHDLSEALYLEISAPASKVRVNGAGVYTATVGY